jgi:capsular polysaccharide biosynthesis protein
VVPERPSSPNVPLNVMAALLAGLVLPITYLTLLMNFAASKREPYVEQSTGARRGMFQGVKARDE